MYIEESAMETAERDRLAARIGELVKSGHRLVQACATGLADSFEVIYSFDLNYKVTHLRVVVPRSDAVIPSATGICFALFTYENEMHDLFGIKFPGLALDFGGNFYRKAASTPFADMGKPAVGKPGGA
jgi:ech hydrogenase subunit D